MREAWTEAHRPTATMCPQRLLSPVQTIGVVSDRRLIILVLVVHFWVPVWADDAESLLSSVQSQSGYFNCVVLVAEFYLLNVFSRTASDELSQTLWTDQRRHFLTRCSNTKLTFESFGRQTVMEIWRISMDWHMLNIWGGIHYITAGIQAGRYVPTLGYPIKSANHWQSNWQRCSRSKARKVIYPWVCWSLK